MIISIGTGITSPLCLGAIGTPRSLFRAGDKGFWLDPSDITTLSQDAAGTVAVTAFGQPVGRLSDRSGNGLHAVQTIADLRPLYARAPRGGARNLFRNSRFAGFSAGPVITWTVSSEGVRVGGTGGAGNPLISIAAVGTDSVGEWIDVRVHGANTTGSIRFINIIDALPVAATPGSSRVISADLQVIADLGPNTPVVRLYSHWRDAANIYLSGGDDAIPAPTTTMTRYSTAPSIAPANTAMLHNKGVYLRCDDGEAFDYTLRIRRIQVEFGSVETAYQATRQFGADITEPDQSNRFALLNDQPDGALMATLPSGTYTVASANNTGVTIQTGLSLSGAFAIPAPARLYGCVAINRTLNPGEIANLTAWLNAKRL